MSTINSGNGPNLVKALEAADARAKRYADLKATEALKPGDACEFRFPARQSWLPGTVVKNGGSSFWTINCGAHDHAGLYIEHVRAPGTDPWKEAT